MQSFFRLSAGLVAVGVLLWASATLHAADISDSVSIGGWVTAATGAYTPAESGGEQAPSYISTSSETRINLTVGTDKLNAWAQIWDRNDNAGVGDVNQQHAQINWMPVDNLEIHMGKLVYLEYTDRAIQWDNYMGWTPAIEGTGNAFFGYIETNDGIDVTYNLGGGMKAGLTYMTEGKVSGTGTSISDGAGNGTVASTIIPHFQMKGDLQILVSYYLESAEGTSDGWANSDDVSNNLLVVDFKMDLGDGTFVKADLLSRTLEGAGAAGGDTADTGISFAYNQGLGGSNAFLELNQNTLTDDDADDVVSLYLRVGYMFPIAEGSKGTVELFQNSVDNGTDTVASNWVGLVLMQSY